MAILVAYFFNERVVIVMIIWSF